MIIPAFQQEFGLKLRYHAPQTYALGEGHDIEIEPGDEALYPLARNWIYVPRAEDRARTGEPDRYSTCKFFKPEPYVKRHVSPDIVICPRARVHGPKKNWEHWDVLAFTFENVFAAGAPDSSMDVYCERAWDYERFLDASIEAMSAARLVIATCSGLSLLAVLLGKPLLLITYQGMVAPGPILHENGTVLQEAYRPIPMARYYNPMNHLNSPIHMVDAWDDPRKVIDEANRLLRTIPHAR